MNARSSRVFFFGGGGDGGSGVSVGELMTSCQMSGRVPQRLNLFAKVRLVIWHHHLVPHLSIRDALQHLGHGDAVVPILAPLFQHVFAESEEDG